MTATPIPRPSDVKPEFQKSWSVSDGRIHREGDEDLDSVVGIIRRISLVPLVFGDGTPVLNRNGDQSVLVEVEIETADGPEVLSWDSRSWGQNGSFAKSLELLEPGSCMRLVAAAGIAKGTDRAPTFVNLSSVNMVTFASKMLINKSRRFETLEEIHDLYRARPEYADPKPRAQSAEAESDAFTARDGVDLMLKEKGWPTTAEPEWLAYLSKPLKRALKSLDEVTDEEWTMVLGKLQPMPNLPSSLQPAMDRLAATTAEYDPFA